MMNNDQIKQTPESEIKDHDEDKAIEEAAVKLADAFATIEEYRDYIPTRIYNGMADLILELRDPSWSSKPDVVRKALPHILRATIEREMVEKEAA